MQAICFAFGRGRGGGSWSDWARQMVLRVEDGVVALERDVGVWSVACRCSVPPYALSLRRAFVLCSDADVFCWLLRNNVMTFCVGLLPLVLCAAFPWWYSLFVSWSSSTGCLLCPWPVHVTSGPALVGRL